ncbi:MAG: CocE/NonD family hydrolase [Alphaproteobacteria bacterium]|nr:CocE/NonD family hydrolase [Alphaproteobacteria bacterium]
MRLLLPLLTVACALPDRTEKIAMRDGVELATDLYIPRGDGPFPAVVVRTPYPRWAFLGLNPRELQRDDVAVVVQSTREDDVFRTDADDGEDTLDWLAEQDWATGEAVTAGPSAMGITQYALGGRAHPGHVGVVAWIGTPDPYGHALFPGGAYREALVDGWLKATGSSGVLDALDPDPALWPVPETLPEGLHIGGWYDVFSQGPIDAFALGGGRLVMGPWTHETVGKARVGGRRFPDADALDLRAMRHAEVLARLDLAEDPDGPRVQYYLMGADEPDAPGNTWREAEDWPPSAVEVRMYLQADGTLAEACPTGGTTAYVSDPAEPVPTLCGRNLFLDAGPCDRAELAERDDVRAFVGPVLDAPREIVGRVTARLHVDLDATDADLVVHLVDVYPDGRHVQIAEGQARPAWRDGAIEPVQGVVPVDVDLWSTAVVLPAGHRVGIHVSSTDFPRLAIAPADAVPWAERHTVEPRPVRVRLHHDPSRPSWVQLPDPQRAAPGLRCETD